jgi:hypothetical protein
VDHALCLEPVKEGEDFLEDFDPNRLFKFGTKQKTRFEPFHIFLKFNPEIKGFTPVADPDHEKMLDICSLLREIQPAKQRELKERIKEDLGLGEYEIRRLLKKGEGVYWTATEDKERKGKPKTYLCIYVEHIYSRHKYINPLNAQKPFNTNTDSETVQTLDNSILVDGLKDPSTQIHKYPDDLGEVTPNKKTPSTQIIRGDSGVVIDLTNEDFEVIE